MIGFMARHTKPYDIQHMFSTISVIVVSIWDALDVTPKAPGWSDEFTGFDGIFDSPMRPDFIFVLFCIPSTSFSHLLFVVCVPFFHIGFVLWALLIVSCPLSTVFFVLFTPLFKIWSGCHVGMITQRR